ncbi:hypothetical protein WICPIJ_001078 [Wickerhamomyces pijperi]|uniref:Uncharacterized protein n=1 Tax=Wickerhamomyces pijperi TaxID=599730 RepID=A0A9P8QC91_WICPI|nr:hypothetical protein WICPIJ_001078 [Wickerhamomyces pijperi]
MKGREARQKRKNDKNSNVVVPEVGIPSWILVVKSAPKIACSINFTVNPPNQACTEYQTIAMTVLFKITQMEPKIPNEALVATGKDT